MSTARKITEADILPLAEYASQRVERRRSMSALKRNRRVELGPVVTFYFECYETMLHQVQEMLYIEKGGDRTREIRPSGMKRGAWGDVAYGGTENTTSQPKGRGW